MSIELQYGEWTLLSREGKKAICRCSCGTVRAVWVSNLVSGKSNSCGHLRSNFNIPNPGDVVGNWTVVRDAENHQFWVRCSCGMEKSIYKYSLLGDSLSCGHERRTGPRSRLTWMWKWMHSRCYNESDPMYPYYGGRGIQVDPEWHDLEEYIKWALTNGWKKASRLQIDRVNNDGNYGPHNCRVCSVEENANNKSNNVYMTAFGETKTVGEWARDPRCSVKYATLHERRRRGWDHELALTKPGRR